MRQAGGIGQLGRAAVAGELRVTMGVPRTSAEARKVQAVLLAMKLKIRALRRFSRAAGVPGRARATLH